MSATRASLFQRCGDGGHSAAMMNGSAGGGNAWKSTDSGPPLFRQSFHPLKRSTSPVTRISTPAATLIQCGCTGLRSLVVAAIAHPESVHAISPCFGGSDEMRKSDQSTLNSAISVTSTWSAESKRCSEQSRAPHLAQSGSELAPSELPVRRTRAAYDPRSQFRPAECPLLLLGR